MRILAVEDDASVACSIKLMLTAAGFTIELASGGEEGIDLAKSYDFDAIVLDHHLPDISGLNVIRRLRAAKFGIPILVLSGDSTMSVRVDALSAGADDFMTKPFHKDELIARLRVIVRRSRAHARSAITLGELVVDLDTQTASAAGTLLDLTTKEYRILEVLCLRRGMTLSKDALLDHLYGGIDEPDQKIIDVFICKLRKKIGAATGGQQYIQTVWGRGYQIVEAAALEKAA